MIEINESLANKDGGIDNFNIFQNVVLQIVNYYVSFLGKDFIDSVDLFIDNATRDSGYTPVTITVLRKYIIIKLAITSEYKAENIAYQFAHELMHFVFHVKYGLDRIGRGEYEESICSAASLICIYHLYPESFQNCNEHVGNLDYAGYRKGVDVAKNVNYDLGELIKLV